MSWKDKLNNSQFKIQTGDGKEFFPLLKIGTKSREYNSTIFEFIDVENSFISRKKTKSAKYDLLFYFQGDDHIEKCDEFENSANDSRFWTIEHPYYGIIKGQPLSLTRNDTSLNLTELSVEFWESLIFEFPLQSLSLKDDIKEKKIILDESLAKNYANKTNLKAIDQNRMKQFVGKINLSYSKLLTDVNYNEYQEILSSSFSSIDKMLTDPSSLIKDVSKLIETPSNFLQSVEFRMNLMENLYNSVKSIIKFSNKNEKSFFESFGASLISSACIITFSPQKNDYISKKEIEKISFKINLIYEDYLLIMDSVQSSIENVSNAFSTNFNSQSVLNEIVNKTLYNLFDFAFKAKQERTVEIEKDSNLIVLTHKYLGLDENDENIEIFRKMNNISNRNIFGVKKGTVIKYLV